MGIESSEDRAAFVETFGDAVRLSPASGAVDTRAVMDSETVEYDGDSEGSPIREQQITAKVRSELLNGLTIGNAVTVNEGDYAGAYVVVDRLREDDGAFTLLYLGDP